MAFQHFSRAERRFAKREIAKKMEKKPSTMTRVPQERVLEAWMFASKPPDAVWESREFLAQLHVRDDGTRLSINRCVVGDDGHWMADISWDELQRIKHECGFADTWAVEIFPPDMEIVNVANMRHLWILPQAPAYGWKNGRW